MGIAGFVIAALLRLVIREPARVGGGKGRRLKEWSFLGGWNEFRESLRYIIGLKSFWLITVSASFRQLSGNVCVLSLFGWFLKHLDWTSS